MIDILTGSRVLFYEKTKDNIETYLESLNMSLFEYIKKNNGYILEKYVINKHNNNILAYYPNTINKFKEPKKYTFSSDFLKLDKNNCIMNKDFTGNYNIDICIDDVRNILLSIKNIIPIKFNDEGLDIKSHGFMYNKLNLPKYTMRNQANIEDSIQNIMKKNNKFIKKKFDYLINISIIVCLSIDNDEVKKIINTFINKMVEFVKTKDINIKFQEPIFVKVINKEFLKNTFKTVLNSKPSIVIFDGTNSEYEKIKQTFCLWGISNQCVNFNKLIKKNSKFIEINEYQMINMIPNILLGLYFKCGKYPWILSNKLNSDCFIGIDISHENGKHFVSCIIYIFYNNELIFREIGKEITDKDYDDNEKKVNKGVEKIPKKIIFYIFDELFKNLYKKKININSIVIHRDGFCRDTERSAIESFMREKNANFSIVCIFKKVYRKIVKKTDKNNYISIISSYVNNKTAYIISSDVFRNKLANPFKIDLISNNMLDYTIYNAINDIYYLTYMCFHTVQKTRLPATIQYSDKCSTSHNRKYISTNKLYEKVFQA